jgi:hypothetical protein
MLSLLVKKHPKGQPWAQATQARGKPLKLLQIISRQLIALRGEKDDFDVGYMYTAQASGHVELKKEEGWKWK